MILYHEARVAIVAASIRLRFDSRKWGSRSLTPKNKFRGTQCQSTVDKKLENLCSDEDLDRATKLWWFYRSRDSKSILPEPIAATAIGSFFATSLNNGDPKFATLYGDPFTKCAMVPGLLLNLCCNCYYNGSSMKFSFHTGLCFWIDRSAQNAIETNRLKNVQMQRKRSEIKQTVSTGMLY